MSSKKSEVWKYFKKDTTSKKPTAICNVCFKKYATSNNTSNLWTHAKKHMPGLKNVGGNHRPGPGIPNPNPLEEMNVDIDDPDPAEGTAPTPTPEVSAAPSTSTNTRAEPVQVSLEQAYGRSNSYKDGGIRSAALNDALLYMVCKDKMPLSTSDNPGFRYFAKTAVPLWSPPSRSTVTRWMESKYEVISLEMKSFLSSLSSVCITADCWTEPHTTSSYLGMTCHYPYEDEMESVVLGVELMTTNHTAVHLHEKMRECLEKWSVAIENVNLAVTDNAANIKLAMQYLVGEDKHVGCLDHLVNLIPKAGLGCRTVNKASVPNVEGVPALVNKIKKIVTLSHSSYNFSNELKRIQMERGKEEGQCLRLLQDVPTRWGSTFLMISRFLEMEEVISIACLKFPEVCMLSGAELNTVRAIRNVLNPFHSFTTEMSAEKTTTASKAIPMVSLLKKKVQAVEIPSGDTIAKTFQSFMLSQIEERFKGIENISVLAKATLLDPRFLRMYFSDEALENVKRSIEKELIEEIRSKLDCTAQGVSQPPAQGGADDHSYSGQAPNPGDLWSSHDKAVVAARSSLDGNDVETRARSELACFLNREPTDRRSNPLKIWRAIRPEYPYLYTIAMRYVPLLATSVACERLFSTAGLIADDRGSRLTSEHLNQRIFLSSLSEKMWMKFK